MTQHTDLLLTLALAFVALAGFAGVVAALGRLRLAPQTSANRVRLTVAVALLALLVCVLPLVLDAANLPIAAVTRLSASFFASGAVAVGAWAWQGSRPLHASKPLGMHVTTILWTVTAALVIALYAVGAGFVEELAPAIYVIALFFCLVLCTLSFFVLVVAIELGPRS